MKSNRILIIFYALIFVSAMSGCLSQGIKVSEELDNAVSKAAISRLYDDSFAEAKTEGHIILSVQDKGDRVTVYVIASYASFGFENDYFTLKSGCGAIPAVIEFSKAGGKYELLSYTEPEDGENNYESTKELFPITLWGSVLNADSYYPELKSQQEEQARAYVKSIGRNEKVCADYVEKPDFNISIGASNMLIEMRELCYYPFWIGTQESIENGIRYI